MHVTRLIRINAFVQGTRNGNQLNLPFTTDRFCPSYVKMCQIIGECILRITGIWRKLLMEAKC